VICKKDGIYYEVESGRWRAWIGAHGDYGRAGRGWNTGDIVVIGAEIESDPPSYRENEIERYSSSGYYVKPHVTVDIVCSYGKWCERAQAWFWPADYGRRDAVQADIDRVKRNLGNYSCWRDGDDMICDVVDGIVDVHGEGGG
jgi:hypothetical protein